MEKQEEVYLTGIELDTDTNMWSLHFKKKLSLKSRIKILWQRFFKKDKADIIYEKVDMCYDELDSGEIKNWHLATKDGKRISFRDLDKICIDEVDINS